MQEYKSILFVDFDGTITSEETLDGALKLLVDKKEFDQRNQDFLNHKVTLSEILHEAFEKTPSSRLPEILEYIEKVPVRDGFGEFLDFMNKKQIPVVVISGGLRPMLDMVIAPYRDRILDTYCVDLDTSGEYMKLNSQFDDGFELLKKTDVMKQYRYQTAISIGDSHTDIKMSMAADLVFARDFLAGYLAKQKKPFCRWNDFFDVIERLKNEPGI